MLMDAKDSIYSPTQEGLIFPREPTFSSSAEERRYRKEHLAAACRIFARHGFSFGVGGHLTVRDRASGTLLDQSNVRAMVAHENLATRAR
ncbi:hypothetical protein HDG35_006575 [Paraburkholderia sp. JPY681]|nr:class II aldolase/adducin family protein [Paraburkholderia atlantica]MBB5510279.1 hypothetical protein [Paraburkholderia atlantica]